MFVGGGQFQLIGHGRGGWMLRMRERWGLWVEGVAEGEEGRGR